MHDDGRQDVSVVVSAFECAWLQVRSLSRVSSVQLYSVHYC
jgi:hypothetical protein